jgi:hypothetical protein
VAPMPLPETSLVVRRLPARSGHSLSWPDPVIARAKGIEMSQIQPRNAFAASRRVDLTESIHTRKEIFQSGHPTDIQHH